MSSTIYLNIGSNQGDCHAHIERAVALIAMSYPKSTIRRSNPYLSESWGYASDNAYVNVGLAVVTDSALMPLEVLHTMQTIQNSISDAPHRDANGNYCDREIDIDIIAIDKIECKSLELTLPHPRAAQRDFVMVPLGEVAPVEIVEFVQTQKS